MALGNNLTKNKPVHQEKTAIAEVSIDGEKESRPELGEQNIEVEEKAELEKFEQYCVFKAGKEDYAVPLNLIKEVVPIPQLAKVPQMPDYIIGMSNVRGNIYGVMDLSVFFRTTIDSEIQKYLLVIDHETYQMGVAISSVPDTLMVSDNMIEKLSSSRLKSKIGQKYLKGILKKDNRMIILFDILGMISSEKFTTVA